jgi:hypothetical protein
VGDLQVQHFLPEYRSDKFVQAALTIEGKLGNWDVTYAGAYLDRKDIQSSDYTDYAEAYDSLYASAGGNAGYFLQDSTGKTIDPRQRIVGTDHFKKMSHELRLASPSSEPVRVVAGFSINASPTRFTRTTRSTVLPRPVGQRYAGHAVADPAVPRGSGSRCVWRTEL